MSHQTEHQRIIHRAKIIKGQIEGLIKKLEKDTYCIDILTQSLAIQKSLASLHNLVLHNHLQTCATEQIKGGKKEKVIEEIMKVYKLTQRS